MIDLSSIIPSRPVGYGSNLVFENQCPTGNMCLLDIGNGEVLCSIRRFFYVINRRNGRASYDRVLPKFMHGGCAFAILDRDMNFLREVRPVIRLLDRMEDMRIVKEGDSLRLSCTLFEDMGKYCPYSLLAKLDGDVLKEDGDGVESGFNHQKNFVPVEGTSGKMVSDFLDGELMLYDANEPGVKSRRPCRGCVKMRGSTPLYRYDGGYICICHVGKHPYSFRMVKLSEDLSGCIVSRRFSVMSSISPISFLCGMLVSPDGECTAPFCIEDSRTFMFRFNWDRTFRAIGKE